MCVPNRVLTSPVDTPAGLEAHENGGGEYEEVDPMDVFRCAIILHCESLPAHDSSGPLQGVLWRGAIRDAIRDAIRRHGIWRDAIRRRAIRRDAVRDVW